jgi:hypothetical protein
MPSLASPVNSVVMASSVQEKKMHYPVITEKDVADRWQVSLQTLRRWRLDGEGPVWHKLSATFDTTRPTSSSSSAAARSI